MLAAWIGIAGFVSADEIEALPTADERSAVFHALPVPPAGPFTPERAAAIVAQNDFNVTHYLLDLDFNDNAQRITGSVTITAKSVVPALAVVPLDLAPQMNVSGVTRNGTALPFLHDGDVLTVTLDSPVANGQSFEIVVSYSGVPVQRPPFDGFGWNKYRPSGGKMAWSLSQPENARIWWPSKDRADDKALVEEWWTVKGSWTATGNGTLQGVDVLESGRKRYRWRATHPLPTYLVSIAATDYVSFSSSYETLGGGSMPIDYYVYSEHLSDAQESFSRTPEMLEAFAGRFGEYPFVEDKYGMSAFPFLGGMEHPTNTSYGYENINGGHSRDFVIAHELAHQWFGDSVTPATADDLWLSEGFASYGEALWREHREGPDGLSAYMNLFRRDEFPGPLYPPETPFNITVYDKGAWALQMLRKRLGDDTFFAAMQSWHEQYRDKNASTAQFQAKMEAFHGESLDTFFAQWIYGEGQPDYTFGHRVARPEAGVWHAWVRVEQVQDGPVFEGPLDLTLETNQGDMVTHTVWNDSAEQYYRLVSDTAIASLHFDRANWALKIAATWDRPGDSDIDGVPNGADNCPSTANADQADVDNDLVGDACDTGEVCNDGVDDDGDQLTDCADPECADASNCIPEICDDGSDNDHDGDADCDDDECIGHPDCVPETCDDGADNNDDGLIDCNDPDCAMFHACVDEICDDAFDNDNDGDTDCDDDECTGHTDCIPEVCDDAADNDTDGLVDCDDPECAAFPDCVPEVCDDGLDNDGDGATDCADPECFEVHGCITEICNDAVDNDGDGDADCADDECADFHACIPEICDDAVDNDSDGATDCADGECLLHHSCLDENCTNGLDDDGDGLTDCDDEECSGEASCIDEICNDGQDNDGDGLIDCADPECADVSDCIAEICDDEIDNDDDGFVDCTDSECLFAHQCTPETCGNGFDDDGDGLTDCADEECADNHACIPEDCGNGLDDDGDGLTDCADEECVDVHTCTDEVCGNGSDDDFDGLTDCADEECADFHGCIDEICGNGADDDGDGSTDCADDECAALPECIFEICDNGVDDDDDGATDCDDDECAGLHGCIDEICGNATDDDGDGLTDCADEECAALPECIAEICDDASDNDGDGLTDCDDDECAGFHDCIDEVCDDSTDNDGDGLADCDDDECAGFHGCIDEICEDDIDNDGDGLTDCDDDECAGFHGCVDEICEDDTDNDGDGLTDCDDDECAGFHGCIDEICEDDTDNDGDGLTDCDDDECADFHGCIDEICDDDTDNDGDGFVDCDDSECSRVASCVPEDCEDLADNNGNGLIDCEDPTCADFHACVVEICDDGIDNDGDGGVDCDDDECTGAHQCITEFCTDNIDNDGDGAIDCADDECADLPACQSEDCGDGIDNDGDGQVDCNDSECVFEPMCTPENCGNGFDDDGDGFTDCNDPECADYHACVSENCGNEVDDDGDGLIDCDDEECVDVAACIEEVCDNGADDDFDGQTDCADDECADFHDCIEEICGNATDDDGDGLTDCDDDECAAESDCIDEICDNATDDDGDGLADCDDDECAGFHGCIDEVCDNASDDDGDGLADCDDDECAEEPHCLFERCDDDVDNDGDGAPDCADPDCEMDSACSMCPLPAGEGVERGRGDLTCFELATGGDTATTHTWSNVPFSRTIADPVVIVGPPTRNGHDHGVVQLRNIGIDGFQTRYMEWTYEDGLHTKVEEFPFFAVPAGLQVLANGTVIQAGRFDLVDTGSSAELRVTFPTIFDGTPTLILTMQTANGSQPVAPRAREVTPDGFTAALYEEEQFMNQHGVETVGYIAVWTPTGWGDLWLDGVNVPFLLQQYGQNQQFTPVLSWDLRYDEETSFDSEYNHATETVDVLAVGHRLFAQDVSTLESDVGTLRRYDRDRTAPLEWGIVRGVTSAPLQVPLHSRYVDPVVIVKAVSGNDLEPGAVRIEGVAEDRFRVRFQEWSYLDGVHAAEDLFYLVVESGRHDFAGLEFEAGTLASDATQGVTSFDTVTYATPFALPPIVFSSVQTTNDTAPVVSRVRAGTESGILITMQEEEASTLQHGLETLGWVAFEEGGATFSGRSFQVTRVRATDRETSFPFPNSVSRRFPSVVADISGFRGFDPAGLRIIAVDRDDVRLFVQEEQSFDAETIHLYDDVSVFIGD